MNFKLFRPLGTDKIQQSLGTSLCDFKSWVAQGKYQVTGISPNGEIELHILDHDALTETLGYDFSRFTCASFESMRDITSNASFPKATAWAGIQSYYAAFFGAHALLRFFGISCSQIEPVQAGLLSKYANLYGVTNKAQAGFYFAQFFPLTNTLKFKKLSDTHKDTWSTFNEKLKALSAEILSTPGLTQEKNDISTFLTRLSDSLSSSGKLSSGNWLSSYRNNLNYKQEYQAWYPYKKDSLSFKSIDKYINDWSGSDFNPNIGLLERDERLRFFGTCSAIMYLLSGVSEDLASIAKKNSIHRSRTARLISLSTK